MTFVLLAVDLIDDPDCGMNEAFHFRKLFVYGKTVESLGSLFFNCHDAGIL